MGIQMFAHNLKTLHTCYSSASTILLTNAHALSSVFVTVYQGRMSAEAADRVAAVGSSRPSTPLQTTWFEFLLDGSLLEKHLQKTNPGKVIHVFQRYHVHFI